MLLQVALLTLKYVFRDELRERLPGILGLLRALEQSSRGLDFIRALLRYLAQVASTDRLSATDLRQAVTQALSGGGELMMTIAEQWVQEGRQEGLNSERQLLLRQLRRRFGEAVAERSRALLERVEETVILEELGEVLLDCADGEAWLALLARRTN